MSKPMTAIEALVENLEGFFEDCVTKTPLELDFTAAGIAAYYGMSKNEVSEVSGWLQQYNRNVQAGSTSCSAEYVVACFERGPRATWHILSWPGMTAAQEDTADGLRLIYEVMSYLREDVDPMVRNAHAEFIPALTSKRTRGTRSQAAAMRSKIDGYYAGLHRFQREINRVTPVALRSVVRTIDGLITQRLTRLDGLSTYLGTI